MVEVHTVLGKACSTLVCVASLKCVAAHPPLLNTPKLPKLRKKKSDVKIGNGGVSRIIKVKYLNTLILCSY